MFKSAAISFFVCVCFFGCVVPNYSSQNHSRQHSPDQSDFDADSLWRQGLGFNNPNPARIRNGQTPLNFNGQENTIENQLMNSAGQIAVQTMLNAVDSLGREVWARITNS